MMWRKADSCNLCAVCLGGYEDGDELDEDGDGYMMENVAGGDTTGTNSIDIYNI